MKLLLSKLLLLFVFLSFVGVACDNAAPPPPPPPPPPPAPTPSPTPSPIPVVDLAMADGSANTVFIYYDVLDNPDTSALKFGTVGINPSVTLDMATSAIASPRPIEIDNNILFVGNLSSDTVTIYQNFLGLSDNQAPDITLDNGGSTIDKPSDLEVLNNDLYVVNQDSDEILIFRDVGTLVSADPPDAVLSGGGLNNPIGLAVTPQALYVTSQDSDEVMIYNDPATLITGDLPDVTLDMTGSLLDTPKRVIVSDNILFVSTDDPGEGRVNAYSPADGLVDMQAPDYVLGGASLLDDPLGMAVVSNRLFVTNRDDDSPGTVAFDDPATLVSGNPPSVVLGVPDAPFKDCEEVEGAANSVWIICEDFSGIYGYRNAGTIVTGQFPDISLFDPIMERPKGLAVQERP